MDRATGTASLLRADARRLPIADDSIDLIVTSPPFLDVVDYPTDNWLRCWFAGIAAETVPIALHRSQAARCRSSAADSSSEISPSRRREIALIERSHGVTLRR